MFKERKSVEEVEEGFSLSPKFNDQGFIPVVTTDTKTGVLLMHAFMNAEALKLTIETKEAHYYSRSRKCIWKKGETSGLFQEIKEIKIDDDQDCVIFKVELKGLKASCHVGYRSCFYRKLESNGSEYTDKLEFTEKEKTFEPLEIYGDAPNPTKL